MAVVPHRSPGGRSSGGPLPGHHLDHVVLPSRHCGYDSEHEDDTEQRPAVAEDVEQTGLAGDKRSQVRPATSRKGRRHEQRRSREQEQQPVGNGANDPPACPRRRCCAPQVLALATGAPGDRSGSLGGRREVRLMPAIPARASRGRRRPVVQRAVVDQLRGGGDQGQIGAEHAQRCASTVTSARQPGRCRSASACRESDSMRDEVLHDGRVDRAARSEMLGHEPGEGALELRWRRRVRQVGHALHAVAQQVHISARQRHHDVHDGACWIGSRRPTAPKSMRPRVPSVRANTLPGCRSKVRADRSASPDRASLGAAGRPSPARSITLVQPTGVAHRHALEPFWTSTRWPDRPASTFERTVECSCRTDAISAINVGLVAEVELDPRTPRQMGQHLPERTPCPRYRPPLGEDRPAAPAPPNRAPSSPRWRAALQLTTTASPVWRARRVELIARAKAAQAQQQVHDAVKNIDIMDPTSEIGRSRRRSAARRLWSSASRRSRLRRSTPSSI